MHQNRNPVCRFSGSGAGDALAGKRCNLSLDLPKIKAKSHWVTGTTEFMYMPDFGGRDECGDIIYLSPPGKGWFAPILDRHDGHTLWQRRVRR
jgi:hypothetical protein